jgi:hypothetical protein
MSFEGYVDRAVRDAIERVPASVVRDVYVVSLFVSEEDDDPRRPRVTVGYNTDSEVEAATDDAGDEHEARWNYAFWLQNRLGCVGDAESDPEGADLRDAWVAESFPPRSSDDDLDELDEGSPVPRGFAALLVRVVARLHADGVITAKFGRTIPVLIHELDYYDEIAEQNLAANPSTEALADFVSWCRAERW